MNRSLATLMTVVASLFVAGCGDLARVVSPAGKASTQPAHVAFTTSVMAAHNRVGNEVVTLRVTASYLQVGGTRAVIGVQTLQLTSAASQAVPIPVDLAGCLADLNREAASAGGCQVVLVLALMVNDVVVDRQTVGPLRLAPGATSQVDQPISLFEITALDIAPAGELSLIIGGTSTIRSTIRDIRGSEISGRTVTWASDAPTVATVDDNGRVTAVGPGEARITASVESASASLRVLVSRAPLALRIDPAAGSGTGVVRSTPAGIDCQVSNGAVSGTCLFEFAADAQVVLTSVPDAGQQFAAWGEACVGNAVGTTCTLTMAQPRAASAQFVAMRRVRINAAASDGLGRVTGSFGIDCRIEADVATGTCEALVADGTPVTVTSTPDEPEGDAPPQQFVGWGGVCLEERTPTCTITASGGDQIASAAFTGPKSLSVTLDGVGGGTVSGGGIACSRTSGVNAGTCSQSLAHGTNVTLTAEAAPASTFVGWSGACSGASTTCVVAMTSARTARASFSAATVTLSVDMIGVGEGEVTLNGGEMCLRRFGQTGSITCVRQFPVGTVVTLEAMAGMRAIYEGWSGACSGMALTCTVTLSQSRSVGAHFSGVPPVTLTVAGGGSGTGVVRSTEAVPLINCTITNGAPSGQCTASVTIGTQITLRAVGSAGSALSAWSGVCSSQATHECTITLNASLGVNANFVPAIDVEMRISGAGFGSVSFQPAGAPSQAPCVTTVPNGTATCRFALPTGPGAMGVFRGTPGPGFTFEGFLGSCAELTGSTPVPVCTYRGIGFLRVFTAVFK